MNLESVIADPPKVHDWSTSGELSYSGLPDETYKFIYDNFKAGTKTIETGMGVSTSIFTIAGAEHTCVNPDDEEHERMLKYMNEKGIAHNNLNLVRQPSDQVWERYRNESWDCVLVDGGHGFPIPFMDWYFFSLNMKVGGYVIIDDCHLWTGRVLQEFLTSEDAWERVQPFTYKTWIFKKVKDFNFNAEWTQQPYQVDLTNKIVARDTPKHYTRFNRYRRKLARLIAGTPWWE